MLGVTTLRGRGPRRPRAARDRRARWACEDTYSTTRVGVFFGEPGETVADPYFGGEGPPRAGCIRCGACMVGCRHNAKNTLAKNYLYFAERAGVQILPERTVAEVRPLGAADGSRRLRRDQRALRRVVPQGPRRRSPRKGVVVAAGPLGTNQLLQRCRHGRRAPAPLEPHRLPRAHEHRGDLGRHHQGRPPRLHQVDRDHLELLSRPRHAHRERHLRPGRRLDLVPLHDPRRRPPQARPPALPAQLVAADGDHPHDADARQLDAPASPSATCSASARACRRRRTPTSRTRASSRSPTRSRAAPRRSSTPSPQAGLTEQLLNIPTTAHIMGGAVIGEGPETGVVDRRQRAFGYENLLVCDGSAIPANVGVNPSLTITALTEHAMSHVARATRQTPLRSYPPRDGALVRQVRPDALGERRRRGRRRDRPDLAGGQRAAP